MLLSLIIVGVIAVITVPVLVGNAQKRMFATKLKNTVAEIEQVAQNELIRHRTRDLANTDFSDPTLILSDKHFAVVKSCTKQNALKDCWKTGATGKDKVVYKSLNNEIISFGAQRVIILKNGVMLKYIGSQNGSICGFVIDVNGNDRPNIIGRDTFNIYLTKDGKSADLCDIKNTKASLKLKLQKCKSCANNSFCPLYCYGYLEMNNWKMDY